MNTIPEDKILSQTGAGMTGTWTRSGIRMGSSLLQPHSWFSSSNLPSFKLSQTEAEEEDEAEVSDWENEVSDKGELFYVVPYDSFTEAKDRVQASDQKDEVANKTKKGKLSRLVRRRESKRDRNRSLATSQKLASLKSVVGGGDDDDVRKNCESSDNDSSSTYGQIKTFETLFESPTTAQSAFDHKDVDDNGSSSGSSGGEVTEIHEVFIKFNAKQFKSQLPHLQMIMSADNPRNNGAMLEVVLGIVSEKRPSMSDEAAAVLESSIRVAGFIEASPAAKASPELKSGDILRSVEGFHVTLDNVNSFLLQKLASNSSSSSCKIKLIIQRPKRRRKHLGN